LRYRRTSLSVVFLSADSLFHKCKISLKVQVSSQNVSLSANFVFVVQDRGTYLPQITGLTCVALIANVLFYHYKNLKKQFCRISKPFFYYTSIPSKVSNRKICQNKMFSMKEKFVFRFKLFISFKMMETYGQNHRMKKHWKTFTSKAVSFY